MRRKHWSPSMKIAAFRLRRISRRGLARYPSWDWVRWDTRWLNRRLIGATVEVSATKDERFVVRDGELIISISYDSPDPWGGEAWLTHIERKYVLHITTAEFDRP